MDELENDTRNTVKSTSDTVNQTAKSVERTCTQSKHLAIPILNKHDTESVGLRRRRFVQYVKMTKHIDLTEMKTSKEIRYEYRYKLEKEVKDIWITEMTKTMRVMEPTTLRYGSYTHYSDFFLQQKRTTTIPEPTFSTWNVIQANPRQTYGNES